METLSDKLLDLRNYVSRYGQILDDVSCEIEGNHYRTTTYKIDDKRIIMNMRNGEVSSVICKD
jgi:hypothetical protein